MSDESPAAPLFPSSPLTPPDPVSAPVPTAADTLFASSPPILPEPVYEVWAPKAYERFLTPERAARMQQLAAASGFTQGELDVALQEVYVELDGQDRQFAAELDQHPELGGVHLAATQRYALRAIDHYLPQGTAERARFDADVSANALTNYVPLIAALARVGKGLSEDGGSRTGSDLAPTPTPIAAMFPSMTK